MVSTSDVKCYKTTNNLGGAITATQVNSANPNNVFTNVPNNERVIGEDYYACVYFKNGHATESMDNFKLWLSSKVPPPDTELKWGFDPVSTSEGYRWEPYFTGDGATTFDSTADDPIYDLNNFTLACWFKTTNPGAVQMAMINKGGNGSDTAGQNDNYSIVMRADSKVEGGFEETSGTNHYATSTATYNDNQWHLAVCQYGGSNVYLWIDDMVTPVATHSTSATPETNAQPVVVGRNSRSSANFWNGLLDEVRIWDRFKSEDSRVALLTNTVSQSGLIFEKKFGTDTNVLTAQTIADKYTAPLNVDWQEVGA